MPYSISESETRYSLIDPQLQRVGWNVADRTRVRLDMPVDGYDATVVNGSTDLCLNRTYGDVLALEETLEQQLTARDVALDEENRLKAFGVRVASRVDFLKHVLRTA